MTFKRILKDTGLTKVELAALYGVSRQSIHTWAKQGPPMATDGYVGRMAETITQALNNALYRKLLPFGALDKEVRKARVARMALRLQSLKPAPAR